MLFRQFKSVVQAFYALFADSGFAMAGAVAYSFVLSFFPFASFLGALAGYFGGEPLAKQAIARLFELVPEPVAQAIAPEVMAVMGRSRFGLLTVRCPHRPLLRHQRDREPARRPQRRLPRQGAARVSVVPSWRACCSWW